MKKITPAILALFLCAWGHLACAQMASFFPGPGMPAASASFATWNPADKNAGLALSNGNLTVTGGAGGYISLRATNSRSTGKFYYEVAVTTIPGGAGDLVFGIGNASASLASFAGGNLNSVGYITDGRIFINSVLITTIQTALATHVACIAVDLVNSKFWVRTDGGNWNNDVIGNQNPASNIGGVSISTLSAGPYFPMLSGLNAGDVTTTNFGATAYAQTPPAGFGNW